MWWWCYALSRFLIKLLCSVWNSFFGVPWKHKHLVVISVNSKPVHMLNQWNYHYTRVAPLVQSDIVVMLQHEMLLSDSNTFSSLSFIISTIWCLIVSPLGFSTSAIGFSYTFSRWNVRAHRESLRRARSTFSGPLKPYWAASRVESVLSDSSTAMTSSLA